MDRGPRTKAQETRPVDYAALTHLIIVAKSGGLPYISRPIRKTFAAHHSTATTDAMPIAIDVHTCHQGGGVFDAIRSSMAKVLTGGTKLMTVLNVEFGSREMGSQNSHG